jgi:hypothetical protein
MTKYEPAPETIELFKEFSDVVRVASPMIATDLVKDLIGVFEQRAQFFTLCERWDYVQGVQDCIDHLKEFLKT